MKYTTLISRTAVGMALVVALAPAVTGNAARPQAVFAPDAPTTLATNAPSPNRGNTDISSGVGNANQKGMAFRVPSGGSRYRLDAVAIDLDSVGGSTSTSPVLEVRNHTGSAVLPGDSVLFTFPEAVATPTTFDGLVEYAAGAGAMFLEPGTSYWFVVRAADNGLTNWQSNDPTLLPTGVLSLTSATYYSLTVPAVPGSPTGWQDSTRWNTIIVTGTSFAPGYQSAPTPGSTIFVGASRLGVPITNTLVISNTGNDPLVFTPTLSGANQLEFALVNNSGSTNIPANGTPINLSIVCTPQVLGARSAQLDVSHNDTAQTSPVSYPLNCNGAQPQFAAQPAATTEIAFGSVPVNTVLTQTIVVSETGNDTLVINDIALIGANASRFTVSPVSFSIIDGGPQQLVRVGCRPTAAGTLTATLQISHNGPDATASFPLSCTGVNTTVGFSPAAGGTIDFGRINPGAVVTRTVSLNNTGGAAVSGGVTVSGTNAASFRVLPASLNVPGATNQPISVGCTDAQFGFKTATLTINLGTAGSYQYQLLCLIGSRSYLPMVSK
jgi:Abnormal spindle-like microcephaly-assoc'd, ASPM-SPD-2-Hydin